MPQKDIVYFDLETQRTAGDVGGWENKDRMGMSVGVTYSTARQEYLIYQEHEAEQLIQQLQRADLVVGFNVVKFDLAVLEAYTILKLSDAILCLDLMLDIESRIGHRLSLEAIAQASLGLGKTADGLEAIRWWREGKKREVAEYCCFDVKVTKLVHEYGKRYGHVKFADRSGRLQEVEVDW